MRECIHCGKVLKIGKNWTVYQKEHQQYTCKKCYREYQRNLRNTKEENYRFEKTRYFTICENCGKVFSKALCHIIKNKHITCSKECGYTVRNTTPWNKGMRTVHNKDRHYKRARWTSEYADWHNICLKRDWYHCQLCGSKIKLEIHHIKSYKDYPEERISIDNGITLCKKCHLWIHNINVLNQQ